MKGFAGIVLAVSSCFGCTQQGGKTAVDVAVKVSDQFCSVEASDPAEPDWIKLACLVEGGVAHVLFPRSAWAAMHPRAIDRDY